jgi:hypothetical protein
MATAARMTFFDLSGRLQMIAADLRTGAMRYRRCRLNGRHGVRFPLASNSSTHASPS